jgi:hypothetical protein
MTLSCVGSNESDRIFNVNPDIVFQHGVFEADTKSSPLKCNLSVESI